MVGSAYSVYNLGMDALTVWVNDPLQAYTRWQQNEAAGVDGKPFSPRSIVQHRAMFERFFRHLIHHRVTLATFGAAHLDYFFAEVENRCASGSATQARYLRLIERVCRHLIELGLREHNPAAELAYAVSWPEDDPRLSFLDEPDALRLEAFVRPSTADSFTQQRERAITALLLATGVAPAELRSARRPDVVVDRVRSHFDVTRHGARPARRVPVADFGVPALAAWLNVHTDGGNDVLLFPSPRGGQLTDMYLGRMLARVFALTGIDHSGGNPRTLRNTYARRQMLGGRSDADVASLLGLVSPRTVTRIRATLPSARTTSVVALP